MPLFPWGGLKRGTVVEVMSSVLTMALVAEATTQGSWAAVVGSPEMGLAAAREQGVALERLVVVHRPPLDQAATVIAALVDALDLVVVGPRLLQRSVDARRLSARARERGSVLVSRGGWLEGPDVSLHVRAQHFVGMTEGHGHLSGWSVDVETAGRGAAFASPSSTAHARSVPAGWRSRTCADAAGWRSRTCADAAGCRRNIPVE